MQNRVLIVFWFIISCSFYSLADEGMWMPDRLKKKEAVMKAAGLKIPVEEIYSEINPSLKDAVVLFGGGCTGAIISNKGLVLTNHHCGYSQVHSLSTLEHNYVKNGFWAKSISEELPCPGLSVTFIVHIENVTEKIFANINDSMSATEKDEKISEAIMTLEKQTPKEKWQQAKIKPIYYGNEYYLSVTETYRDIRLAGIPPVSLGRFGGDLENWLWPAHTVDFSVFRIYADSLNLPSDFSESNTPYTPKKSFTLCTKGIQEGDFTMVYGFPGKTTEYIPSFAVELIQNSTDPAKVHIRDQRLSIWRQRMNDNDTIRLKYASRYGTIANYWKKWDGEMKGLKNNNVIKLKQDEEVKFIEWMGENSERRDKYSGLLHEMELFYGEIKPLSKLSEYYAEAIQGIEMIAFLSNNIRSLEQIAKNDSIPDEDLKSAATKLLKGVPGFFKNYDAKTDELVMASMLQLFHDSIEAGFIPEIYGNIQSKYKNDFHKYARDVFRKSIFTDEDRLKKFLSSFSHRSYKKIIKDPAYRIYVSFAELMRTKAAPELQRFNTRIASLQKRYMKAQMEMNDPDQMYPDANLTMRISYGNVKGYQPRDAVQYKSQTYLSGLLAKNIPGNPDFDVPLKLQSLYAEKDFGDYAVKDDVPVAFIASNHTTGGNSGSPVINANGELTGTNFDRVWEGILSDIQYYPEICRNVSLDIRFTLFIIQKLGGAQHIIDELQIIK